VPLAGKPRNGPGTASWVIGVIALVASVTIVGGVILGVVAAVLGAVAHGRAKRGQATNGGAAIAGLVLGIVATVPSGVIAVVALLALLIHLNFGNSAYDHCIGTHPGNNEFCDQYRWSGHRSATSPVGRHDSILGDPTRSAPIVSAVNWAQSLSRR
jgi:hypothetical protein